MRLEEVFIEAKEYKKSVSLSWRNEEAFIYRGIKISKLDDDIKIFSTFNANFQYRELNDEEYSNFNMLGWVDAVHLIVKRMYKKSIDRITGKIKTEINTRNNKKHYDSLKTKRETLINKYSNLK